MATWLNSIGNWNTNVNASIFGGKNAAGVMQQASGFGKAIGGLGINAGNIGGIANTIGQIGTGLLAGQNQTGVGNAIQTIGGLASNIPGVGGLIGAGVGVLGGLVNAAFGSHINDEFVTQTENQANQLGNRIFGANTNGDLLNDWQNVTMQSSVSKSEVGSDGWFSSKASDKTRELNRQIEEANARQLANFNMAVQNADANNDFRILQNMAAYGGPINSFRKYYGDGGEFDQPQTFFGRVAQSLGVSPKGIRGTDIVSSIAQMTPYGHYIAALDLGRDANRAYHKEEGAWEDIGWDVASMLPFLSKAGLKEGKSWFSAIKGNDKLRNAANVGAVVGRTGDFVSDTYGANKANIHDKGGYLSQAKALIRQNEGWRDKPYADAPKGKNWRSVGYGFNDSGFREKYPEGISKHYEHGITKKQAEEELDYFLNKAEKQLKSIYGKQWNDFTDSQKAAILDTYYQRPASVGKSSRFYKAVTAGEDAGRYLGVAGYNKRNKIRQGVFGGSQDYVNLGAEIENPSANSFSLQEVTPFTPVVQGLDLSGITPTQAKALELNLTSPTFDLSMFGKAMLTPQESQVPTVGTVEDFLASYEDFDNMLYARGGFLGRSYEGEGSLPNYLERPKGYMEQFQFENEPIYGGSVGEIVVTGRKRQKPQEKSAFEKALEENPIPEFTSTFPIEEETVQTPLAARGMSTGRYYAPLSMDNNLKENEYLNSPQFVEDTKNKLASMSKEEVMQLQTSLARRGYYDLNSDNMTEKEVKALQTKLYNKGLLKGDRSKEIDGKIGPKTREAYRKYMTDGIVGSKTTEAYLKSISPARRWSEDVPTDNTEWCAQWVTKKVRNASGEAFGVTGDAWRMPNNIVKAGGEMLYNIYDDNTFNNVKSTDDLKSKTVKAINNNPFDISQLQVGDIVGIYMPSSDMHETALNNGTTYNTHVGVVTGFNKDGVPIIEHNIHKNHHRDRADRLTGSKEGSPRIATVTRPAYSTPNVSTLPIEEGISPYVQEGDHPLFKEYADGVAGAKSVIGKMFPNADMDAVEQAVLAVQGRETNFMRTKGSDLTGIDKLKYKAREIYRDKIKETDPEAVSSDLSKMKLSSFTPNERHLLGIKKPSDLNNPELAGRAATYMMAKNYDYFKRLSLEYPELGLTEDDLRYLTELSYNQGMDKLKTIGFDERGNIRKSEIEAIREMAKPDAKVKDISSTNYRHLGAVGKFLYDRFGSAHTPYISAAEKYRSQLLSRLQANPEGVIAQTKAFGGELNIKDMNIFDFGGGLTHGADWDTGINWVGEGGSHGQNPLGGVQVGVDEQGIPNLVEEGEAIWNGDYVFSKRMKVPKKLAKKYGLGGDITFADAVAKLTKSSEERPLSMIDQDTNDVVLGEFADVQEEMRAAKAQRAMDKELQLRDDFLTGFQYGLGGHMTAAGIIPDADNVSPFELASNMFAYGGPFGNVFEGTGSRPNSFTLNNDQSLVRRIFGDNSFTRFMENASEAVNDPLNYFAGDEIESMMNKLADMTEPQMERFFKTPVGQIAAKALITLNSVPESSAQQAGVQRWYKSTGRLARPVYKAAVNAAKRSMAQSRVNARGQMRTPTSKGSRVIKETTTPAQIAKDEATAIRTQRNSTPPVLRRTTELAPVNKGTTALSTVNRGATGVATTGTGTTGMSPYISRPTGVGFPIQRAWDATLPFWGGLGIAAGNLMNWEGESEVDGMTGAASGTVNRGGTVGTGTNKSNRFLNETPVTSNKGKNKAAGYNPWVDEDFINGIKFTNPEIDNYVASAPITQEDRERIAMDNYNPEYNDDAAKAVDAVTKEIIGARGKSNFKPKQTWTRNVPIWLSGAMGLKEMLTPADYGNADAITKAAYQVGAPVSVGTEYIGDYRKRDPFNTWYLMHNIDQTGAAANRNFMNLSGGNSAVAMAGILANDLATQRSKAEAARQGYLADRADDASVSEFNRGTNLANMQAQNHRNQFLAGLNSQRQQAMLSGISMGSRMRQAIKDQRDAAIYGNLSNFAQGLGDIGWENSQYNMIGGLADEDVLKYIFDKDFITTYKNRLNKKNIEEG